VGRDTLRIRLGIVVAVWTSLLALSYVVAGVNAVAPLLFNLVSGTLLLVTLYALMRARAASGVLTFVVLAVTVLIARWRR